MEYLRNLIGSLPYEIFAWVDIRVRKAVEEAYFPPSFGKPLGDLERKG